MKKAISILIIISMVFSMTITCFAVEKDINDYCTTEVIDEVSLISRLQGFSNLELKEKGFSDYEINQIRTFDYEKELAKRAALDDKTLNLYGYSKSEIEQLRKYVNSNGTKGSISSATMTTSLSLVSKTVNATNRKATFKFTWKWNRLPFIKLFDTVGAAWESLEGHQFAFRSNGANSVKIVYTKIDPEEYGPETRNAYDTWSVKSYNSIEYKFGVSTGAYFAMRGEGTFEMESTSGSGRLYVEAGYAHLYIGVKSPSVSIGSGGSFGFSLTFTGLTDSQMRKQLYNSNLTLNQTYV